MTDRAENAQVTRRLLEVFEDGRLDAIDELVHPQFINHEAPPGSTQGPEGLKQTISFRASATPSSPTPKARGCHSASWWVRRKHDDPHPP
jgi:hypothetical protein